MSLDPVNNKSNFVQNKTEEKKKKSKGNDLSARISSSDLSSSDRSLKLERSVTASSSEVSDETVEMSGKTSKRETLKRIARKIFSPISKIKNHSSLIADCSTALDTTYKSTQDGNDDIAYANKAIGCLYVVDGANHNDPLMKRDLEAVFSSFNTAYEKATKGMKFDSLEEAQAHVSGYMNALHDMIRTMASEVDAKIKNGEKDPIGVSFTSEAGGVHDFEPAKLPAMSFGQVVKIKGESFLLSAQYGDTSLVIQRSEDHSLDFSLVDTDHDTPLGQRLISDEAIRVIPLKPGDRVLACSDGIMEFLPKEKFESVVTGHPASEAPELLKALKDKVINSGEKINRLPLEEREKHLEATSTKNSFAILGANQRALKTHTPHDKRLVDDISLSVMTVK